MAVELEISIYQIQHSSFGINIDFWLLGPSRLGAVLGVVAHFLAVIAD